MKAIKGVMKVEITENLIKVDSSADINNLDKLILYFTENIVAIKSIESKTPNLESVFLTLTGRKLRD